MFYQTTYCTVWWCCLCLHPHYLHMAQPCFCMRCCCYLHCMQRMCKRALSPALWRLSSTVTPFNAASLQLTVLNLVPLLLFLVSCCSACARGPWLASSALSRSVTSSSRQQHPLWHLQYQKTPTPQVRSQAAHSHKFMPTVAVASHTTSLLFALLWHQHHRCAESLFLWGYMYRHSCASSSVPAMQCSSMCRCNAPVIIMKGHM
jgi:hypothetical protein